MKHSRLLGVAAGGIGVGAALTGLARALADTRTRRAARVWRMTVRNTSRFVATKVRGVGTPAERRAELDAQFAIRSAEDVARELGNMKGVLMKVGQLVSYIAEGLPEEAQAALAALQADAEPMAPTLAAEVVKRELGAPPEQLFARWTDLPVAAASVGQVHRAYTLDGRDVAVKVQYPGVDEAIDADLDSAEVFYAMFSALALHGLDPKGFVDELRARMREELDYVHELDNQQQFARYYSGHPWIRIPAGVPDLSTARVLTTEWVDGMAWDQFVTTAASATKQLAAEVIWRFAQHSVHRLAAFNGDPHPGNYRFHHDGSVTFLDFGLVKRWAPGEWERLEPSLDAIVVYRDPERLVQAMEHAGFLRPGHGLDAVAVYGYVSSPYLPYLVDEFTFTRAWMRDTLATIFDIAGPHGDVIARLNMPPSFVILDRVVWGVSAIMGKLEATGPWRSMLLEYRTGSVPVTELGAAEAHWFSSKSR
ncbi:MAG: AarF/ABC1/UbiB kinase family protein [Actinomycetota bacterium]|nr:AarF/ABC1/UbiB kinase family protein [Actinomycetota bacterium]